jgi:hypothetical protein
MARLKVLGFAEPVIGPATSGRTRWLNPSYGLAPSDCNPHLYTISCGCRGKGSRMRSFSGYLIGHVMMLLGYLGAIATLVGLVRHYGSFTLSSIPLNVYEEYSFMRDQIFWAVNLLMFSWWSEIVIPNVVKDFLSLYLFFALAYAGTIATSSNFLPKIIRSFFGINVRLVNVPATPIEKILRSLYYAVTWPFNLWRWIWRPGDWGDKIKWAAGVSDETKELVLETRKANDRALLIAFLLTVTITATSVFLCFSWSYLQAVARTAG